MKSMFPPAMKPVSFTLLCPVTELGSPPAKPCAGNPKGKPGKPFDIFAIPGKPARNAPGKAGKPGGRFWIFPYSGGSMPSPESLLAVPLAEATSKQFK